MAAHRMKDGRWAVWLSFGSDAQTGKRNRRRIEAKTKREAESRAAELRARHARGEAVLIRPRTLTELLGDWLAVVAR